MLKKGKLQALLASDGCGEALPRQLEELFSTQSDGDLSLAIVRWTEDSNGVVEKNITKGLFKLKRLCYNTNAARIGGNSKEERGNDYV